MVPCSRFCRAFMCHTPAYVYERYRGVATSRIYHMTVVLCHHLPAKPSKGQSVAQCVGQGLEAFDYCHRLLRFVSCYDRSRLVIRGFAPLYPRVVVSIFA